MRVTEINFKVFAVCLFVIGFIIFQTEIYAQQKPDKKADNSADSVPASPSMTVFFERAFVRESDFVNVEIKISNSSDKALEKVSLLVKSPKFVHWSESPCQNSSFESGQNSEHSIFLNTIAAYSVVSVKLYVCTDSTIDIGEFNNLFTLQYSWKTGIAMRQFIVSNEKSIKANLFGSDSVAGIPISLASFIIPGLFFWITLQIWGVVSAKDLSKELIYSVIISILLIGLVYLLRPLIFWLGSSPESTISKWLKYIDISSGISVIKLLMLAGIGFVAGNIIGVIHWGIRTIRHNRLIQDKDDTLTKLEKIIRENHKFSQPKTTIFVGDVKYEGSLAAVSNGMVWLVGWFKIDLTTYPKDTDFISKINKCKENDDYLGIIRLAKKNKIPIVPDTSIKRLPPSNIDIGELLPWKEEKLMASPLTREEDGGKKVITVYELED